MKRFCRYIRYAGMLLRYALALLIGIFARHTPAYRDLWLFAERGYDAQDNAFFLFQFVRQKHPDIHAAYLINRASPDYGNIIRLGKAIEPGSFSHYLAFACAKVSWAILPICICLQCWIPTGWCPAAKCSFNTESFSTTFQRCTIPVSA